MSPRQSCGTLASIRAVLLLPIAIALAGCAAALKDEPKPITEDAVRARLVAGTTLAALQSPSIADVRLREELARHFAARADEARRRGLQYTVEKILVGEDIGIGAGVRLMRIFALVYEHDVRTFTGYLEAIQVVGSRVQQALRSQVAQNGVQLASLEFLDLDRAAVRTYRFAERDPRCCPSLIVDRVYAWRGMTLEELR